MKREIHLEWFYPYTAEEVWACLTEPDLIARWLMPNDFKAEQGHRFRFTAQPVPGWSGIVDCQVIEVVPLKKLSYSWVSGPKPGKVNIDTVVTWHLLPEANGIRLKLEHTGFKGFTAWMVSHILGKGWKSHIAKAFAETLAKQSEHEEEKR
jgi:uncharacterized protein YndB with AHSA1/START domain